MSELLAGAALSSLVFLFYFIVCLLLPAVIGLFVASWLPLVGGQVDGRWLRLRTRMLRGRRLRAGRSRRSRRSPQSAVRSP